MDMDSLAQTLDCGQCFRWNRCADGSWEGVARGRFLHITAENFAHVLEDGFWAGYFDAGFDYGGLREKFAALDPIMAEAVRYAPEMRILNQEPWEALCSFILSQCNNIKRIKGMVNRLCEQFGDPIPGGRTAFPTAERLACASADELLAAGCGYRVPYVLDAARRVSAGKIDLERIRTLPIGEARSRLMEISGVGNKVADCALLYGLHRLDAFPMDVWMKRAMRTLFPGKDPSWFGPDAGVAQQYLFHYSRNHPELFGSGNK